MVEAVLHLLEVEEEVIGADSVVPEQAFLGVGPEAFDSVDRGSGLGQSELEDGTRVSAEGI